MHVGPTYMYNHSKKEDTRAFIKIYHNIFEVIIIFEESGVTNSSKSARLL